MTISSTNNRNTYSGNGSTSVFAYTFKILDEDEILVQWKDTDTGVITTKTKTTHYTVSNVGNSTGGNITFTAGNIPASGTTVIFLRDMSFLQETDYTEYDAFPAESHEEALDRLTMMNQQLKEAFDRTFFFDAATADSVTFDYTMPDPTGYGGYMLAINTDADGFEYRTAVDASLFTFPAGNGILAKTSATAATVRTITGTANEITVTNGTGVSGDPTLSLPSAMTLTGKTITGGTFASPTFSGTLSGGTYSSPTFSGTITGGAFGNTSLKVYDTDASHTLGIVPGSNLTANRTLTFTTGDASRTVTLSADLTVSSASTVDGSFVGTFNGTFTGTHSGTSSGTNTGDNPGVTSVATSGLATGGTITSTGTITVTAATQSDQETGTSTTTVVTPGRQHYHPGHPKAWATVDDSGTASVLVSYNVSSVTDNGTGDYTVNFTTSFSSSNFCVTSAAATATGGRITGIVSRATGSVRVLRATDGGAAENGTIYVSCFGDQ